MDFLLGGVEGVDKDTVLKIQEYQLLQEREDFVDHAEKNTG